MFLLTELLVLLGCLLAMVAASQVVAARLAVPESTLLCILGILVGTSYVAVNTVAPGFAHFFVEPLVNPNLPADAYLWIFLPPLLFQVALTVDVRSMMQDAAPILLLAVVAVIVATGLIGLALGGLSPYGWPVCLLIGAIVATTDPSAVVGIFREVGAPGRLIRLVEGESLLNDAAAIALVTVLMAMISDPSVPLSWESGLSSLSVSFGGGVLLGLIVGRITAFILPLLGEIALAETAFTLAIPYPVFLFGNEVLGVSGVVAVVVTALVINGLSHARLSRHNWNHLQLVWAQIASIAGAIVFLLASVRVPQMLSGMNWADVGYLLVAVLAALLARLAVLYLFLPLLSALRLSEPISHTYKLAITWGGLRGAVTLVLAMGMAENSSLPENSRHFIAIMATSFVLFSLLVNGSSLRTVIRKLGLDKLSPQEQALQQQAIELSTLDVEATVKRIASTFHIDPHIATEVNQRYRAHLASSALDLDAALPDRERLAIGLVTLAAREHELIRDYGSGIIGVANLDAMLRNTGKMIDEARTNGRIGYNRAARRILKPTLSYRLAVWLYRYGRWKRPLASALADHYELMICRRVVLERLRYYNASRLNPLLGERMAGILDGVLAARIELVDQDLRQTRTQFGQFTDLLERRLLWLFALRKGRAALEEMVAEQVISREVYNWVQKALDSAWRDGVERPDLHAHTFQPKPAASAPPTSDEESSPAPVAKSDAPSLTSVAAEAELAKLTVSQPHSTGEGEA
ncbi:sodium:proton antiporter [Pokkaliibacter sp. MBI-7]|uniref:cation:proton antiporter n=1 Tax=Pokkaliibacter sp. MBI-7 TaxID=3040600 RepID=UPI00244CC0B6|nr:sodium:proton antiporter [Pokkaliibacter sp. MBI-7]MDH2434312.1 sodium:proton antiporter [Pokkaliibacter sp. MBI-7]